MAVVVVVPYAIRGGMRELFFGGRNLIAEAH